MNKKLFLTFLLMGVFALWLSPSSQVQSSPEEVNTFGEGQFFQLPGGAVDKSSPTLADITGDGVPEVLVGTTGFNGQTGNTWDQDTRLVAMSGDGSILWSVDTNAPINSSPSVGDMNNDGQPEIVVGVGGDVNDRLIPGGVIAYDRNGNQLWRYQNLDYDPVDGHPDGVYSSPTMCDVDNDNDMEIVVGGWDQRIYMFDHLGNSLWNNKPGTAVGEGYFNVDTVWSTAACADLNQDGEPEIIIGADISGLEDGSRCLPDGTCPGPGGFLYVFDKDGHVLVRRFLNETVFSSPAVGDLDGNGTLEIVTGTGWYWWNERGRTDSSYVYAFDTSQVFGGLHYQDEAKLPHLSGWPKETPYPGFSSPALADLDGDNDLEVIIGTGEPFLNNDAIAGAGRVYAWHHTGTLVNGWPVEPKNANGDDTAIFSSPTVADVDNDGQLEVLFSMIWDVHIYNADGTFQEMLQTSWTDWASPAIGDTDNNGYVEVWIASGNARPTEDSRKGYMWRFEQNTSGIGAQPWPQFHRDAVNSGYYPLPAQLSTVESQTLYHNPANGNSADGQLSLNNSGESTLNFRAESSSDNIIFSSSTGQIAAGGSSTLAFSVNTSGLAAGSTHSIGTIRLYDADSSSSTALSQVQVSAYVGDYTSINLPLVIGSNSSAPPPSSADLIYWTYDQYALSSGHIIYSSPVTADLNGDNKKEIIVASSNQKCTNGACTNDAATLLMAVQSDGSMLWSKDTAGPVRSAPAAADINQDGQVEVVVTIGQDPYDATHHGRVVVFDAQGNQQWSYSTRDRYGSGFTDGIFASPTLCDLTGDGKLEIVFGALDGYIYALRSDGQLLWEFENQNGWEIRSTAACTDLNSDGRPEIIVGTFSDANANNGVGGYLYVLSHEGSQLVRRSLPEAIHSSPAVADLDNNGSKEIVVGTGMNWWQSNGVTPQVYAFSTDQVFSALSSTEDSKLPYLSGWPQTTDYPAESSPALADFDGDGDLEIVIGTGHPTLANDQTVGAGKVYAWHHNGQAVSGWPVQAKNQFGNDGAITSSPVIADIDQDNRPEIIFSMIWDLFIYNTDGTVQNYPTRTLFTLASSPVVDDTDGDGKIDIWVGGSNYENQAVGYLWHFESDIAGFGQLPWPMFRQNARNSGSQ